MTSLMDIQRQIELLQQQAKEIKAQEYKKAIEEIQVKMTAFGITVADLQGHKSKVRKTSFTTKPAAVKFRGPNGETWSGRGLMPRWLSSQVAQGRAKEEFAV
jgi:DNA-binding protein H-NS